MKVTLYPDRDTWLAARSKKITGSTFKKLAPTGGVTKAMLTAALDDNKIEYKASDTKGNLMKLLVPEQLQALEVAALTAGERKQGFYQLIADRLTVQKTGDEKGIDRGHRLEPEAIKAYEKLTGTEVNTDLVIWEREDNDAIALSPDGSIEKEGKITKAVEAKCLDEWLHIKTILTNTIPSDYDLQKLQYFIVNDDLEELDFVFHNELFIPTLQTHIITVKREEVQDKVDMYIAYQRETIKEVNAIVAKLTM